MNGLKGTDLFAKVFNRRPELAHTYICHVLPGKVIYILSLKKQNFKSEKVYNLIRKPKTQRTHSDFIYANVNATVLGV